MKKISLLIIVMIQALMFTGCSSNLFLSTSQRLEKEADSLMAADRTSEALLAYHQAIQADKGNHAAIMKLIPQYQQQGRMREAEFLYGMLTEQEKASLDPKNFMTNPEESTGLKLNWMKTIIQDIPVGLAADSDTVAATYQSGEVLLLQLSDGAPRWSLDVSESITSAPSLAEGVVLLGCESGDLIALDREKGTILWKTLLPGTVFASPRVDGDQVYAGSYGGKMTALDLRTGGILWQMDAGDPIVNQPELVNDTLYFGTTGGTIYSLDRKTGASLWEKPARLSGSLEASPVMAGDMLLMASNDSRIYAIDKNGREYYWQYSTPDSIYANPLVQEYRVFVFSIGQVAAALDLTSGSLIWEANIPAAVRNTPVISSGKLYFSGVSEPYLYQMDAASGQINAKINTGDWIEAGPLNINNTLLLAGKDGAVIAYRLD